jgi:hypothetical protein
MKGVDVFSSLLEVAPTPAGDPASKEARAKGQKFDALLAEAVDAEGQSAAAQAKAQSAKAGAPHAKRAASAADILSADSATKLQTASPAVLGPTPLDDATTSAPLAATTTDADAAPQAKLGVPPRTGEAQGTAAAGGALRGMPGRLVDARASAALPAASKDEGTPAAELSDSTLRDTERTDLTKDRGLELPPGSRSIHQSISHGKLRPGSAGQAGARQGESADRDATGFERELDTAQHAALTEAAPARANTQKADALQQAAPAAQLQPNDASALQAVLERVASVVARIVAPPAAAAPDVTLRTSDLAQSVQSVQSGSARLDLTPAAVDAQPPRSEHAFRAAMADTDAAAMLPPALAGLPAEAPRASAVELSPQGLAGVAPDGVGPSSASVQTAPAGNAQPAAVTTPRAGAPSSGLVADARAGEPVEAMARGARAATSTSTTSSSALDQMASAASATGREAAPTPNPVKVQPPVLTQRTSAGLPSGAGASTSATAMQPGAPGMQPVSAAPAAQAVPGATALVDTPNTVSRDAGALPSNARAALDTRAQPAGTQAATLTTPVGAGAAASGPVQTTPGAATQSAPSARSTDAMAGQPAPALGDDGASLQKAAPGAGSKVAPDLARAPVAPSTEQPVTPSAAPAPVVPAEATAASLPAAAPGLRTDEADSNGKAKRSGDARDEPMARIHGFARGALVGQALSAYGGRGHDGAEHESPRGRRSEERESTGESVSFTDRLPPPDVTTVVHAQQPTPEAPAPAAQPAPNVPLAAPAPAELPDVQFLGRPPDANTENASIAIHHPDLGPIQLEVHRDQGRVEVHAILDTVHAEAVLRANERGIRQGVQQSGMTFGALRVRVRGEESTARPVQTRRRRGNERET